MFAGAAGSSLGARDAGAEVIWAANHEPLSIAVHQANFPTAEHVCEDLVRYDHGEMPEHDLLIASPVCRGHSPAGRPGRKKNPKIASKHNRYRATAWSVLDALEIHEPGGAVIENVDDWRAWPLYQGWLRCVQDLGYTTSELLLTASRWGVPQRRTRLFVVATRKRVWLEPSLRDRYAPEPGMRDCVDWDSGEWMPFSEAGGDVFREQLEDAHRQFRGAACFVQLVDGRPVFGADEPLRTMTTKDQLRWVHRKRFRYPTARELFRLMGFGDDYVIPPDVEASRTAATALAGDAVCPPVMRAIVERMAAAL
jgi:DNA (cytosine-5)-methyltransferase 1